MVNTLFVSPASNPIANPIVDAPLDPSKDAFSLTSKPVLERMIKVRGSLSHTADQAAHRIIDRLENEQKNLQTLSKKHMDHLLAVANRTMIEHTWLALKAVAECFISVLSFNMGILFLTQGNSTEGNALIAFGIFNILQTVFTRQGMWDWITRTLEEKNETHRERLKMVFPIMVSFLSLGFSIASPRYMASYMASIASSDLLKQLEQVQTLMGYGGSGVTAFLSIQKGFKEANLAGIQADLKAHEQTSDFLTRLLDYLMKETRRIKSSIKNPINKLIQAQTLATQKV